LTARVEIEITFHFHFLLNWGYY